MNLRPATLDDVEPLFALHRAAFRSHIEAIWGWDEAWQRSNFKREFESSSTSVIEIAGQMVGYVQVREEPSRVYLQNIALSVAVQGNGIGSAVVREFQREASERNLPLVLSVFRTNARARRLYERLGFRRTGESGTHIEMTWHARIRR